MIVNKFKIFESLTLGAIERGEHKALLESESLDEGILSSITNYFSKMFGGAIDKLDKILEKYKASEIEYWSDWADARSKAAELDVVSKEAKTDTLQQTKYKEQRARIDKLQKEVENKRTNTKDALERQAKNIIKDSARLADYWDLKKAVLDEQAARESFAEVKKTTDDETIHDLFDNEIQRAAKKAKEKEASFKEEHGGPQAANDDESSEDFVVNGIKMDDMFEKSLSELEPKIDALDIASLRKLYGAYDTELKDKDIWNKRTMNADEAKKTSAEMWADARPKMKYMQDLIRKTPTIAKDLTNNTDIVTDATHKEVPDPAKVIQTAIAETPARNPDVKAVEEDISKYADKFFTDNRFMIENKVGEMKDEEYKHLQNDLIGLFGKLTFYYKQKSQKVDFNTMRTVLNFAKDVYDYKKSKGKLASDLSDKELNTLFDKISK
jgi:hypothetical protein